MKIVKIVIVCLVVAVVWPVTFLYHLLLKASGEEEPPVRVGGLTGSWPVRWLW